MNALVTKSEYETFNMDILEGVRNHIGEEFRIETRGKNVVFVICDATGKKIEFNITYENRNVLEKIKPMLFKVSDTIAKASGNILRAEDK